MELLRLGLAQAAELGPGLGLKRRRKLALALALAPRNLFRSQALNYVTLCFGSQNVLFTFLLFVLQYCNLAYFCFGQFIPLSFWGQKATKENKDIEKLRK